MLGACSSNPLDSIVKLSEVKVADDPVAMAVAEALDDAPRETVAEIDAPVEAGTIAAEIKDPAQKPGFFSRLLSGSAPQEAASEAPVLLDTPTPAVLGVTADISAEPSVDVPDVVVSQAVPSPRRAGFFGRLFGGSADVKTTDAPQAEVTPAAAVTSPSKPTAPRRGLFGPRERTGPDAALVTVGTQLPYGEIATNCDVSRRQLGTKIEESSGFTLYDTIPNATGLRTHYITGFKDRCARQFTAATSIMGDIGTHEVVRYLPSNKKRPYSDTDNAYETIKSSFCRVGFGQPCGKRLDKLDANTTFITAYRNFGSNPSWSNILLHKGAVVQMASSAR